MDLLHGIAWYLSLPCTKTIPEATQSQFMTIPTNMRNFRYCEIIPVFRSGINIKAEVYNTIGLNDCPSGLWNQLDEDTWAEKYGAIKVRLNGPRYWEIHAVTGGGATAAGRIVNFEGIEMKLVAVLETKLWEATVGESIYSENVVQRTNAWIYHAGNKVYELTSPEGDVYRMQSYSQIIDPTLTIEDLNTLGDQLNTPEGWSYQAHILNEDSELIADGLAYIINDELGNTYQKIPN